MTLTRINTIHPSDLLDQWLIAEWRELPRIPNNILSGKAVITLSTTPKNYKLGANHVRFFYNKLLYLQKRHAIICDEMDRRGINRDKSVVVNLYGLNSTHRNTLCNDWIPTKDSHGILIERLCERFELRKKPYAFTINGVKHTINTLHTFNEYYRDHLEKYLK